MLRTIAFLFGAGIFQFAFAIEHQCFPEVMSLPDYIACLEKANVSVDKELKQVFGKVLTGIAGSSLAPAEKAKRKAAAEKAQLKWHEYREAECALAASIGANGGGPLGAALECQFGISNGRIKYLHDNYNVK